MDKLNLEEKETILPEGTTLQKGKYRIDKFLSSGGFGIAYMATNVLFEEKVAIKEFFMKSVNQRDDDSTTISVTTPQNKIIFDEQKAKFMKEAKRLRSLHNQHIVHVTDLFEENGTFYYVMDYIDGESLNNKVDVQGKLPEKEVLDYLSQILDALEEVHNQKMFHLDLKPSNIMVDKSGQVYLIDFGASKQQKADGTGATSNSALTHTPGYAPLEQMSLEYENFGPWTDLYALGATLYNLLTGQKPPSTSKIADLAEDAFEFPSSVSQKMRNLIFWMMKGRRGDRPQSITDVRKFLNKGQKTQKASSAEETTDDGETILNSFEPKPKSKAKSKPEPKPVPKLKLAPESKMGGDETILNGFEPEEKPVPKPAPKPKPQPKEVPVSLSEPEPEGTKRNNTRKWAFGVIAVLVIIWGIWLCKNGSLTGAGDFHQGLAWIEDDNEKFGFIDKTGTKVIPCNWDKASDFSEGLARVADDSGKYGFIDKTGALKISYKWNDADDFFEGLARVTDDNGKYGFIDKTGSEVIPCNWDEASDFSEGLARVKDANGKYGFIDKTGVLVIPCSWEYATKFTEGLASVSDNRKYGFINKDGILEIPCKWEHADDFSEGFARVVDANGKYGFVDKTGKEVIPCKWNGAGEFSEGLACVEDANGKWGYIDKTGSLVIPCQWTIPFVFSEGFARVVDANGKYGFVDKTGKEVIPCQWNHASDFSEGLASVANDEWKVGYIDKTGLLVLTLSN